MFDTLAEHNDFHYATDSELDRAEASQLGAARPNSAWISTDRDVWHRNPHYKGPLMPHPEDEDQYEPDFDIEAWRSQQRTPPVNDYIEDLPF